MIDLHPCGAAQSAQPPRLRCSEAARRALTLGVLALTGAACAEVQFQRTDGAAKYRPLPSASGVQVVTSANELPQPTADLGELSVEDTGEASATPDNQRAADRLRSHAARYGCDGLVALKANTTQKMIKRKKKRLEADGKQVIEDVDEPIYTHHFTARCVRTAAAPGGLQDATEAPRQTTPLPPKPSETKNEASNGETDPDVVELWSVLGRYRRTYLAAWSEKLAGPPPSAMDALDAFHELMAQITGPSGFWRKTLPQQWFGCVDAPGSEQCKRLTRANEEMAIWDDYQKRLAGQKGAGAKAWLKSHKPRMLAYCERFVPVTPNMSAAEATGYYLDKLR